MSMWNLRFYIITTLKIELSSLQLDQAFPVETAWEWGDLWADFKLKYYHHDSMNFYTDWFSISLCEQIGLNVLSTWAK